MRCPVWSSPRGCSTVKDGAYRHSMTVRRTGVRPVGHTAAAKELLGCFGSIVLRKLGTLGSGQPSKVSRRRTIVPVLRPEQQVGPPCVHWPRLPAQQVPTE